MKCVRQEYFLQLKLFFFKKNDVLIQCKFITSILKWHNEVPQPQKIYLHLVTQSPNNQLLSTTLSWYVKRPRRQKLAKNWMIWNVGKGYTQLEEPGLVDLIKKGGCTDSGWWILNIQVKGQRKHIDAFWWHQPTIRAENPDDKIGRYWWIILVSRIFDQWEVIFCIEKCVCLTGLSPLEWTGTDDKEWDRIDWRLTIRQQTKIFWLRNTKNDNSAS